MKKLVDDNRIHINFSLGKGIQLSIFSISKLYSYMKQIDETDIFLNFKNGYS